MKAIIPAAGLGTRFLPATKAQPKEMLPVVDKPTIQYVVEEAVASGIMDVLIITGRGKRAIEDHFDRPLALEMLKDEEKKAKLLELTRSPVDDAEIFYIRQKQPKGLGHAVLCAKNHVGREPFAAMLGDDIIISEKPCLAQLMEVHEKTGFSVMAVEKVPMERIHNYGVIKPGKVEGRVYEVEDVVEKPPTDEAPSNLAVVGRYIWTPEVFDFLEKTQPGLHGEIQLTDAVRELLKTQPMYALEFEGTRYDIGSKPDWIKANIELALARDDLKDEVAKHIRNLQL